MEFSGPESTRHSLKLLFRCELDEGERNPPAQPGSPRFFSESDRPFFSALRYVLAIPPDVLPDTPASQLFRYLLHIAESYEPLPSPDYSRSSTLDFVIYSRSWFTESRPSVLPDEFTGLQTKRDFLLPLYFLHASCSPKRELKLLLLSTRSSGTARFHRKPISAG